MQNVWLVIKQEIKNTIRQPSFWLLTFLMPLLLLGINSCSLIQNYDIGTPAEEVSDGTIEEGTQADIPAPPKIGLVDEGGLITQFPPEFPSDFFIPYPDEPSARTALEMDDVEQYIVIPADYLQTGQVTVYDKNFQFISGNQQMGAAFDNADESVLGTLINYNLTGDLPLVYALQNPTPGYLANQHRIRPGLETDASNQELAILVANMLPYVFYFLLVISSSYLMRSVVAEKENRTAEVLLLSLHPRELMLGKILGLGTVTFFQLIVWLGGGYLILNRGAVYLNVSTFTFPPGFIAWALVFLVLGYILYGAIMAAAGAIAQNAVESGQVIWILIVPLMPTLMFGSEMLANPHGTLSMVLSLFPFSAPSAMVTRIAIAPVPLWQIGISLAGLAVTAYVFVILSARFFQAGNLLSQTTFNWKRFATAWRE